MNTQQDLTVLVLTFNEEENIKFLFENIHNFAKEIVILDSFSTDKTVEISKKFGARVIQRNFDNFSNQRKFSLEQIVYSTEWIFVLDADETLTEELKLEISQIIHDTPFDAFEIKRRFYWQGKWIKRGYYPTWLLRLGRIGKITCDSRSVNEHLICRTGNVGKLNEDFIDYNRKGVGYWLHKHNIYSDFESKELEKGIIENYSLFKSQYERKRWIRQNIWNRLPIIVRPFLYFVYRYILSFGFLDGIKALHYHLLHAFVYRLLIDLKYYELKRKKNSK